MSNHYPAQPLLIYMLWDPPVPLPAPAARCRPECHWGSSCVLPQYTNKPAVQQCVENTAMHEMQELQKQCSRVNSAEPQTEPY